MMVIEGDSKAFEAVFSLHYATMNSLIIDLVDYSFSTFLRYLVDLIPVGRLLMFRNHIDQHHVSKFLFLFYFIYFFSGGLIFLLIFFNVLMMYKKHFLLYISKFS